MITHNASSKRGYFLIQVLVFAGIAVLVISSLISFTNTNMRAGRLSIWREQAFQAAEAGIEYYRWHLAHARTDYKDGTTSAGPYVHSFYDKDGVLLGTFTLTITPPPIGSTLVTIKSVGVSNMDASAKRTIIARLAIPSFAKFAVVSDSNLRFGAGTEVFGPIHANGGIRFDGIAHNLITSARSSYNDPDSDDCNEANANHSYGVHTCDSPADSSPPTAVPSRPDVFMTGRTFPVPAVDFTGITANLAQIKTDAQAAGKYFASSGAQGYKIVLKTNDTYDVYKVTSLAALPSQCNAPNPTQAGWGSWSVNNTTFVGNFANPANGLIFVEDNVWVEGQVNSARITIAAARFPDSPTTRKSITVNNNLLYTNYDGQDVISLMAQDNINAGMVSQDTLRIDAALIAQNGRVGRYFYERDCSPYDNRSTLTLYGMVGSADQYGFAYTGSGGNYGYTIRNIIYDSSLLYAPPPSFPLTTDQYQVLSWQEVENN